MGELTLPPEESDQGRALRARSQEMFGIREARRQLGQVPTVGRRVLLQSPIWFDTRVARKHITTSWVWEVPTQGGTERRGISTINNEPLEGRPNQGNGFYETGGLLRWVDLDLMLALSYHWQETGKTLITIDQKTALSWIGYEALEDPPFEELRASIWRLQATQFRYFLDRPTGGYEMRILQPLLMNPSTYREGKRAWLTTTIGEGWISEIKAENQTVDLRAYLNLVRGIRMADAAVRRRMFLRRSGRSADAEAVACLERPPDISRSILLFLDSLRQPDQHSSILKLDWLQERFGDRRVAIPVQNQTLSAKLNSETEDPNEISLEGPRGLPDPTPAIYEYTDPLHERSIIRRSLESLCKLKILSGYETRGDRLEVRWSDPRLLDVPKISEERPRQARLFEVDRITGETRMVDADTLPPVLAQPPDGQRQITTQPRLPVPTLVDPEPSRQRRSTPGAKVEDFLEPGILGDNSQRVLGVLADEYVGLNGKRLKELADDGWTQDALLALIITTIYHAQERPLPGSDSKVLIPRKFILARLASDSPAIWLPSGMRTSGFNPDAILKWFKRTNGLRDQILEMLKDSE